MTYLKIFKRAKVVTYFVLALEMISLNCLCPRLYNSKCSPFDHYLYLYRNARQVRASHCLISSVYIKKVDPFKFKLAKAYCINLTA